MNVTRKIAVGVGALAAATGATVVASPAQASNSTPFYSSAGAPAGYPQITSCLDAAAPNGTIGAGTKVEIWQCTGTFNQQWSVWSDHTIRPANNASLCLDANGSTPLHAGTNIQLWPCNGGTNQMWYLYGQPGTFDQIKNYSGYCLDVNGSAGVFPNGTGVDLWNCNYGTNQDWSYTN